MFTKFFSKRKPVEISSPTVITLNGISGIKSTSNSSNSCLVNSASSYQLDKELLTTSGSGSSFVKNSKTNTSAFLGKRMSTMTFSERNLANSSLKTNSHQNISMNYPDDYCDRDVRCFEDESFSPFHRQSSWNSYRVYNMNFEPHCTKTSNNLNRSFNNTNNQNTGFRRDRQRTSDISQDIRTLKPKRSQTLTSTDRLSFGNLDEINPTGFPYLHTSNSEHQRMNSFEYTGQMHSGSTHIFHEDKTRSPTKTMSFPCFPFLNISQELLNKSEVLKTNKFYGYELLEWISDTFSPPNSYLAMHFCNCLLVLDVVRHSTWDKTQAAMSNAMNIIEANRSRTSSPILRGQMTQFNQDDLYEWTHKIISNSMDRRLEAFEGNFQFRLDSKIQEYELQLFKLKNDNVMTTCELQSQIEVLIKEVEKYQVLANINNLNRLSWMSTSNGPQQTSNFYPVNSNTNNKVTSNIPDGNDQMFVHSQTGNTRMSSIIQNGASTKLGQINGRRGQSQPPIDRLEKDESRKMFLKTLEEYKNQSKDDATLKRESRKNSKNDKEMEEVVNGQGLTELNKTLTDKPKLDDLKTQF